MSDTKALIFIDMQNDYLWEQRKPQFSYDTKALTGNVNALIHEYADAGCDVIYIRHLIQNLPTNRLLFGYSIAGTEGAELYSGLDVVSKYCFDKLFCVTATALGAAKRGINAKIISRGTATVFPGKKVEKAHQKLEAAKVRFI